MVTTIPIKGRITSRGTFHNKEFEMEFGRDSTEYHIRINGKDVTPQLSRVRLDIKPEKMTHLTLDFIDLE